MCASAGTSFSWNVQPGPYGGYRVSTSWGNYMVVVDGNRAWVGTEEEFENARIKDILRRHGDREISIDGQSKNEHTIVSKALPTVRLGNAELAGINTTILFGVPADKKSHRPAKAEGYEYVSTLWVQGNRRQQASVKIYDEESKKSFQPFHCEYIAEMTMHSCEFAVPRTSLTHKSMLIFTSRQAAPSVVPMSSIAFQHHRILIDKYKHSGSDGIVISDDDASDLRELHKLDSTVPASFTNVSN